MTDVGSIYWCQTAENRFEVLLPPDVAKAMGIEIVVRVRRSAAGAYVTYTLVDGRSVETYDEPEDADTLASIAENVGKNPAKFALREIEFWQMAAHDGGPSLQQQDLEGRRA